MKFTSAIDAYMADAKDEGQINSPRSEVSYRAALQRHAEDVGNRDPRKTTATTSSGRCAATATRTRAGATSRC